MQVSTNNLSYIPAFTQTSANGMAKAEVKKESGAAEAPISRKPQDAVSISEEAKRLGKSIPVQYHEPLPLELLTALVTVADKPAQEQSSVSSVNAGASTQANAGNISGTAAISAGAEPAQAVFAKLKETFPNIDFVTGADPFAAKNVKNNGRNTVYLDAEALRKIENDPRYAARVFANIESSLEVFGKGYSYSEGGKTTTLSGGALNLSFYGNGEGSKVVASMITYTDDSKATKNGLFSFGESREKALHRRINDLYNRDLRKWFDAFNVREAERVYYDFDEAWSKLQAAQKGIVK